MQSDTNRKGIRSTRGPRLDVDIGPESNDLAIVQRSKDACGVEGVNMMPEITNRHSKPICRIVVAGTEFTGKPFYPRPGSRRILSLAEAHLPPSGSQFLLRRPLL